MSASRCHRRSVTMVVAVVGELAIGEAINVAAASLVAVDGSDSSKGAAPQPETTTSLFHIVGRNEWSQASELGRYAPAAFAVEGFVHLSQKSQILRPANLLYRDRDDLVLLRIDPSALHAEVVYEPGSHGEAELFPHLYGQLNIDAVTEVIDFPCSPDGSFVLPSAL